MEKDFKMFTHQAHKEVLIWNKNLITIGYRETEGGWFF